MCGAEVPLCVLCVCVFVCMCVCGGESKRTCVAISLGAGTFSTLLVVQCTILAT